MLKIMLCSNLHTRMTARILLGDGCWSFQVWGCATFSRASKTYCSFWLVLFSVLGLEIYAMMEVKMLTERFIMVLNVFKGFSSPVYVAPWAVNLSGGDWWNKHAPAGHIHAGASWQEPNEGDHPDHGDKEGSHLKPSGSQCLIVLVGVSEIMPGVSDVLEKYGFLQVINKNSSSWSLNFRFGPEGPNLP